MSEIKIQDYILESVETDEGSRQRTAIKPVFEVLFQDCGDFVISRKTKTTEDQLVVICSQHQFYIKKIKGGSGTKPLTERSLLSFVNGIDGIITLPNTYFEGLPSNRDEAKALYHLLTNDDGVYAEAVKQGTMYISTNILDQYSNLLHDASRYAWQEPKVAEKEEGFRDPVMMKKLFKILSDKKHIEYKEIVRAYTNYVFQCESSFNEYAGAATHLIFCPQNLKILIQKFGIGGVYDFLSMLLDFDYNTVVYRYEASDLNDLFNVSEQTPSQMRYDRRIQTPNIIEVKYNPKDFFEYLTYQPYIQGYDIFTFISAWADVLSMEYMVFGKITEKYPKALASLHQKLSTECAIIMDAKEEAIYKEKIDERYDALESNSMAKDNIQIIPAKSREEILDIARKFNNCLASYVSRYASGSTDIYFMYKNDIPEVAIEIKDGCLRQAFQAQNMRPNKEQFKLIESFCNTNGFMFTKSYAPC